MVGTTLVLSLIVIAVLGQLLVGRIADGLLEAKIEASLVEARAGLTQAQAQVAASDRSDPIADDRLVDQIAVQLANRGSSTPRLFDVLLLSASPGTPQRGSNLVSETSVPLRLRAAVARDQIQAWTYTTIAYTDGRPSVTGLSVGAPLSVPGVGAYELYYLFPLGQEQSTLDLVRSSVVGVGLLLVLLLGFVAWIVTRQVVVPVRAASQTAARLAEGNLSERMKVKGTDDLARLATSFNEMAASLARQIRQLEELSRVQQRFVSDVSHELRTPLTTIRMAADVVYDDRDQLDAPTSRAVELLQNQLDRFEELLVDLLEISRFDAGAAVLDAERTDLVTLVQRSIEAATPLAVRNGMEVRLRSADVTCLVECDPRRVHRIIRNLIENAVEHGNSRGVDLVIAMSDDAVAVTVRDYGVGLRPGESALVFNRFWRADPARARTTGGTGLGLAIALEDARLHGGWLEAWGEPGNGACFRLTLPLDRKAGFEESPLPLPPVDEADEPVELPDDVVVDAADPTTSPAGTFVINAAEKS